MNDDIWNSVVATVITKLLRKLVDRMKEKFGDDACLEIYTDGSGSIRCRQGCVESDKLLAEFDGLGELSEILQVD